MKEKVEYEDQTVNKKHISRPPCFIDAIIRRKSRQFAPVL